MPVELGRSYIQVQKVASNLNYYLPSHRCPKFRPCFRVFVISSFHHTSEFYHENSSRSFYNVIIFRCPGGARQCLHSGHFLVLQIAILKKNPKRLYYFMASKIDFKFPKCPTLVDLIQISNDI